MSETLTSSCELLLGLAALYLLAVGLLTVGLPRILMGSDAHGVSGEPLAKTASAECK